MTKEKNIATLNEHLTHWKRLLSEKICDQSEGEKTIDALQNAIKALKQEPCADCISRESIIEIVNHQRFGMSKLAFSIIAAKVKELPSVTPQPKIGRWVMSDDGLYRPICNNCGAHPWKGYVPTVEEATEVFKYCPNCGAKISEIPTVAEEVRNENRDRYSRRD